MSPESHLELVELLRRLNVYARIAHPNGFISFGRQLFGNESRFDVKSRRRRTSQELALAFAQLS